MWKLVIEDDEGKRTIVPLARSEYTIGRREGSSIRLTERNISRGHARLCRREPNQSEGESSSAKFVLEDMTSYNGVFVNGLRVSHAQAIEHGDLVQIGDYRIVLQDDALAESAPAGGPKGPGGTSPPARASTLLDRPHRLVMLQGPTPGAEFPLDRERLMIGRAEDADVSINHNSVSRLHCEVHALGDSRFELVDKGSSNGVRVNGAELQRGFVEPGDVIDLGDVKFRFVGAGQVFRQESMRLAVLPDRRVDPHPRSSRMSNVLPMTVFALVALAGAVGAWSYTRPSPHMPSAPTPESSEEALLREAKRFCTSDDCEAAHVRVQSDIPESSRWRDSQDFKDIESQWAEVVLARAAREPDAVSKRALYQRVAQTMSVDAQHRRLAADRLQAFGQPSSTPVGPSFVLTILNSTRRFFSHAARCARVLEGSTRRSPCCAGATSRAVDPARDERAHDRVHAVLRELEVVLVVAALVGVPGDLDERELGVVR
jgi:pSer/pThr/pTyr-binding forkhead associated (FHA) protein